MRKSILVAPVAGVAVAVLAFATPALAQKVRFAGEWVDADAVPAVSAIQSTERVEGDAPEPDWARGDTGPYAWGTSLYSVYNAGPCDGAVRSGTWTLSGCFYSGGDVALGFPVHIPTGALVSYARLYYRQTVAGDTPSAGFWKADHYGVSSIVANMDPPSSTSGDQSQQFGPFSEVIDNAPATGNIYGFLLINSGTSRVYKMMLYYTLQVSPAPASATFTDVPPTAGQFPYVEALVDAGITSGCSASLYCPDSPVTRGQMAVFLARALGLSYQY